MGRYYEGDIEGKFWFAVQSSHDADFFGVEGYRPQELIYYFEKEHLKDVKKGVKECLKQLGKYKKKLDAFFKGNDGYNNEQLAKYLKVSEEKTKNLLIWYARLELGIKIRDCIKQTGSCNFTAEC